MTIGYFVFSNLRIPKMTFMSFFSQFCHSALSRLSRNSMKFYLLARFRETIPTVKSVSSSEI